MFSDKHGPPPTPGRSGSPRWRRVSPADGILAVGDVILGVGGKPFSHDPRTEFGKALTLAESEAGGGELTLTRWRDGKTEEVTLKLPVLGTYSATAPYDLPEVEAHPRAGLRGAGQTHRGSLNYKENPITRSLNALALLASGDPAIPSAGEKGGRVGSGLLRRMRMQTWYYGYVIMLLSEYEMATGDDSVMPGLRRLALEAANGQSIVGSWGHRSPGPTAVSSATG